MRKELLGLARKRLGAAVAPKEIEFRTDLPKNSQRQDHATFAKNSRTRLAGGRSFDAGERRAMTHKVNLDHAHLRHLLKALIRIRRSERQMRRAGAVKLTDFGRYDSDNGS